MIKSILQTSRISKAGLIVVCASFMFSCEKWIDPEINTDPTAASEVPMSLLIPTIQLDIGYNLMGNDVVRPTSIWMQMIDGVGRCSFMIYLSRYYITEMDVNNLWESIYTQQLINAKHLIQIAEMKQSPYNAAVGQVLTAYVLGITTDLWGDIPYSDALRESDIMRKPVFDSQEQIYTSIHTLLDQAILNLSADALENLIDIEGDVYYDGDEDAWLKAARAIKARHTLQLSKRNGTAAYTAALALTDAFSSNADNMICPFSTPNQNPLFQFMEQRAGDIVMCSTLLNEMEASSDPRIPFYFGDDAEGGISGSDPGSENFNASVPGEYLAGQTSPTYLMSYAELKFIEAEAALQTGDADRAVNAYKNAVAASVVQVTGDANTTWLDTYINIENAGTITLEKIIMQKRHALIGQLQPFSDWRRTGIPNLLLYPDARLPAIPQRFPYAFDELTYNQDNVPDIGSIIEPVWWAQ
jgi:hypothetical protein